MKDLALLGCVVGPHNLQVVFHVAAGLLAEYLVLEVGERLALVMILLVQHPAPAQEKFFF